MADGTPIEWTDATWNPIVGCSVVSPGCTNCYAMRLAGTRMRAHPSRAGLTQASKAGPVWTGEVRFQEQWLAQPLRWRKPRMIFVCAHADLFHEAVPDEWIDRVFAVMALAPHHTFQVLTKRPERMRAYLSAARAHPVGLEAMEITLQSLAANPHSEVGSGIILQGDIVHLKVWPLPNVWLGVSVEDQRRADERVPILLDTPAAVRWVSAEPLLGPIRLDKIVLIPGRAPERGMPDVSMNALMGWYGTTVQDVTCLDWVVVGGESSPDARPMHPDWARSLRDQCAAVGLPFLFKQWGEWVSSSKQEAEGNPRSGWMANKEHPHVARAHELYPENGAAFMARVGKKAASRLLDGVLHDGYPGCAHG